MSSDSEPALLVVGEITGVFGVRGEVKLRSWCDPIETLLGFMPWIIGEGAGQWTCTEVDARRHSKGLVARLNNISDRDAAEKLVGQKIRVPRALLPPLPEGEYYWADLEGASVVTLEGRDLGHIDHMISTPGNDVMVVRGDRERLLPFTVGHCVKNVDLAASRILVDWDPDF